MNAGSYVITGEYKPTFWSEDKEGEWHRGETKQSVKNVKFCRQASMSAKSLVNIGATDESILEPVGQTLEIVPLENPANFKVNKPFRVRVLLEGKPLKTTRVVGTFDGFLKDAHAFYGTTDLVGEVEILALRGGKWMLGVTYERNYENQAVCDKQTLVSSLAFEIK